MDRELVVTVSGYLAALLLSGLAGWVFGVVCGWVAALPVGRQVQRWQEMKHRPYTPVVGAARLPVGEVAQRQTVVLLPPHEEAA